MKRQVSMEEISDGKRYTLNDMVKAGCGECKGCFECCKGMGNSVVLDPLDVHRIRIGLGKSFDQLLEEEKIELQVVDGVILPNLKMCGREERCAFLNTEGRCAIHAFRPGICRLFPLGRLYEEGGFHYFLQIHECKNPNRTKVKVRKWIDTPEPGRYDRFITDWHYFLKDIQERLLKEEDGTEAKRVNMMLLQRFFVTAFTEEEDFYGQFDERIKEMNRILMNGGR